MFDRVTSVNSKLVRTGSDGLAFMDNLGVTKKVYEVKGIDSDYFNEDE